MAEKPIKIPLPLGKVLVFDHIAGKVYVTDQLGPWMPPR